jgi:hypothetical protein
VAQSIFRCLNRPGQPDGVRKLYATHEASSGWHTPKRVCTAHRTGLVVPFGSSSLSLLTVEHALAEMEGASSCTTLGGLRRTDAPTSPYLGVLRVRRSMRCFRPSNSLLNPKGRAESPSTSARKPAATAPRTSSGSTGGGVSRCGEPQTNVDADAESGAEDDHGTC